MMFLPLPVCNSLYLCNNKYSVLSSFSVGDATKLRIFSKATSFSTLPSKFFEDREVVSVMASTKAARIGEE